VPARQADSSRLEGVSRGQQNRGTCGAKAAGIFEAGENILTFNARMSAKNIGNVVASTEICQDSFHPDTGSADDRASVADSGVDLDSFRHGKELCG